MGNYLGSEFNNWMDMWNNQKEFKAEPKEAPHSDEVDFFGQHHKEAGDDVGNSPDAEYWDRIYKMSRDGNFCPDPLEEPQVLHEDAKRVEFPNPVKPNMSEKELGDVVKAAANSANPIPPSTVGKDQDYKANFADVHQLEQLHDMKINLHELEAKLNANAALGKSKDGQKVQSQIDELKKKIDELSDSLTPNFLQSYLS